MSNVEQARALFFEALAFLDASDFPAAEARLRQALRLSPDNPAIFTNLSVALLQQGNRADAREFAAKAYVADPRNIEALLVLADCHTHAGDLTAALDDYDRITALEPGIAEAHNNRGLVLHRLARPAEALASCDRAIALSPSLSAPLRREPPSRGACGLRSRLGAQAWPCRSAARARQSPVPNETL